MNDGDLILLKSRVDKLVKITSFLKNMKTSYMTWSGLIESPSTRNLMSSQPMQSIFETLSQLSRLRISRRKAEIIATRTSRATRIENAYRVGGITPRLRETALRGLRDLAASNDDDLPKIELIEPEDPS
jgi:hypothetical protein